MAAKRNKKGQLKFAADDLRNRIVFVPDRGKKDSAKLVFDGRLDQSSVVGTGPWGTKVWARDTEIARGLLELPYDAISAN
jgi:hypothetical protein